MFYSKHYEELDTVAQKRYREKLNIAGLSCDPYLSSTNFLPGASNRQLWPKVEYHPDIFNYLVNTTSPYTMEQLKAYKSMDGYNFFIQGWVGKVEIFVENEVVVLKATVRHSQSVSSPLLHPWIAAEKCGTIICAHCTCMAGIGEACSHAAALLFAAEANTQMIKSTACTSGPCTWSAPSLKKVEYARICDIDFKTPRKKRRMLESNPDGIFSGPSTTVPQSSVKTPTDEELGAFFYNLSQSGTKSSILSLLPQYCDDYIPRIEKGILPRPLTDLYNKKLFDLESFPELSSECEKVHGCIAISQEHSKAVEQATRSQSQCKLWYVYRAGRITASNFKSAVHTNLTNPSPSLIKQICYPQNYKFKMQATQWGIHTDHEKLAISSFYEQISNSHTNLNIHHCGLIINPLYSHLGASPDGIIECSCCNKGVLEVKCPYRCKDLTFKEASNDSSFCLESDDTTFRLRSDHSYYYQVQLQMKLCEVSYCYFIVWSPSEMVILKIDFNDSFLEMAVTKASEFFKIGVLPELVGKWYSRHTTRLILQDSVSNVQTQSNEQIDDKWCYCRGSAADGEKIGCDDDSCSIMWFHMDCLNSDSVPDGERFCPDCQTSASQ